MNPILILGYERSGTTLLRRIVSMHPKLKSNLVHEKYRLLFTCDDLEEAKSKLDQDNCSITSGQKIPYYEFSRVKSAVKRFNSFFGEGEFSVIHIIRDPIHCINSQKVTFRKSINQSINFYFRAVPKTRKYLRNNIDRCLEIRYEDIIDEPHNTVHQIYKWLDGTEVDTNFINKVVGTKYPWFYNGRIMVGLRSFDKIEKQKKKFVLPEKSVNKINSLKEKYLL
jgi:hypothetical protein